MRVEFFKSSIVFSGTLQIIGAISSVLLGVAIFLQILLPDAALDAHIKLSDYLVLALLLIVPPLFVLGSSYHQLRYHKLWAVVLLLIAGLCSLIFVGLNAGFTFLYARDKVGQFEVLADLLVLITTLAVAVINAVVPVRSGNES